MIGNSHLRPQREGAGRRIEKPKEKGKDKGRSGGKAKGRRKGLTCCVCGGVVHAARLRFSEGWVNDLEEDAPEGENANEDGSWTEVNDETYLVYFGSDSCLMNSHQQLRDASIEAGWAVVTRKSRNRKHCSRRRGELSSVARFSDLCVTMTTT